MMNDYRAANGGNSGCVNAANHDGHRVNKGTNGSQRNGGGGRSSCLRVPGLPGVVPSRSTLPSSFTSLNNLPTGLPGLGIISPNSSSKTLNNTPTRESSATSTSRVRGRLSKSSTFQFTTSVRYTTDPSGITDITSIGVPPGTFNTTSAKSSRNAGVIAGAVISILFILIIIGFLLHRRQVRRRNRVAPSAQYMAEYGDRRLSRSWNFFNQRGNSQHPDISHRDMSPTWQGKTSQSGHSHVAKKGKSPWLFGHVAGAHMEEPEMRETQGLTNVRRSLSVSASKTSIGAAAGHSPAQDNPFADGFA